MNTATKSRMQHKLGPDSMGKTTKWIERIGNLRLPILERYEKETIKRQSRTADCSSVFGPVVIALESEQSKRRLAPSALYLTATKIKEQNSAELNISVE